MLNAPPRKIPLQTSRKMMQQHVERGDVQPQHMWDIYVLRLEPSKLLLIRRIVIIIYNNTISVMN